MTFSPECQPLGVAPQPLALPFSVCFPFDHHCFPYTASAFFKLEFCPELSAVFLPENILSCGFALGESSYIGRREFFPVDHLPYHETTSAVLGPPVRTSETAFPFDDFSATDGAYAEILWSFGSLLYGTI